MLHWNARVNSVITIILIFSILLAFSNRSISITFSLTLKGKLNSHHTFGYSSTKCNPELYGLLVCFISSGKLSLCFSRSS